MNFLAKVWFAQKIVFYICHELVYDSCRGIAKIFQGGAASLAFQQWLLYFYGTFATCRFALKKNTYKKGVTGRGRRP